MEQSEHLYGNHIMNMKKTFLFISCISFLVSAQAQQKATVFTTTIAPAEGFLKTSGTKIVNEKGENILLRGVGLGGWMLQEGYMLRLQGINPQYSIRNRIEQLIGAEQTQRFYDAWLQNFTTKADIDSMRR